MQTAAKRSRFIRKPTGIPYRTTDTDLDIIAPLQPYKYLPSTYLIAFNPQLNPIYVKNRLTVIRHEMGLIECPPSSWHAANARYRPAVYQLTPKGHQALAMRARRIFPTNEDFEHEFGVCLTAASLALGAKDYPEIALYDHEAILASSHCPADTRLSKTPFQIPITFTYHYKVRGQARHKDLSTQIKHDWLPMGFLNRANPGAQIFFPGIEYDRHTESLESEDYSTITIEKKVQAIEAFAAQDGYFHRYGIPNTFVPWVTISEQRMRSIMRVVEKITKGSKRHLFTYTSDFASFESLPPANGSMLTRDWKRVGHEDFNILRELGVQ